MGLEQIFEPTDFRKSASEVRRITDDEDYLDPLPVRQSIDSIL